MLRKILFLLLAALAGGGGLWAGDASFSRIQAMRQLERIPRSEIRSALPGEVNLEGNALNGGMILAAPDTKTPCLYFHYLVEREDQDSDGNTSWTTIENRTEFVPFLLRDATGEILARPTRDVDFEVRKKGVRREGKYRYSEWRIDPGDRVTLFGMLAQNGAKRGVGFGPGSYTPIITTLGESAARSGMATVSVWLCWVGLVGLSVAVFAVCGAFGVHRLLVFLTLLTVVLGAALAQAGLAMMETDITDGLARLSRVRKQARAEIAGAVTAAGGEWSGRWEDAAALDDVPGDERERVRRIRLDVAAATRRVTRHMRAVPERWLIGMWGLETPGAVALPDSDLGALEKLEAAFVPAALSGGANVWVFPILGALFAVTGVWFGLRSVKVKRYIENVPTSKSAGAAFGIVEIKGQAVMPEGEDGLETPLQSRECVHYRYLVEEYRHRGKNSSWVTREDEDKRTRFLCRDDEGDLPIDPENFEIIVNRRHRKRSGRWRYTEWWIEIGDEIYAIGEAQIDPDTGDSLILKKSEDKGLPAILSNRTEAEVMLKKASRGMGFFLFGFTGALLTALLLFGGSGSFAATDYLMAAMVAPVFLTLLMLVLHYNDLVFLRDRARRNWANIEVSLKKRFDLIPRFTEVAKAYLAHEKGLQARLAKMRGGYKGGAVIDPTRLMDMLDGDASLLSMFRGLEESYPDLKGNESIAKVMEALTRVENELALMRAGYNDAVRVYNTRIATFPDMAFARMFRFESLAFARG